MCDVVTNPCIYCAYEMWFRCIRTEPYQIIEDVTQHTCPHFELDETISLDLPEDALPIPAEDILKLDWLIGEASIPAFDYPESPYAQLIEDYNLEGKTVAEACAIIEQAYAPDRRT